MSEQEQTIIEELRESYKKYGAVRPIIRTKFGIASGETRKKAVEDWPEITDNKVQTYYDHLKLKAADNVHQIKSSEWWEGVLTEAGDELLKQGIKSGHIVEALKKDFPLSEASIRRYLPQRFKMESLERKSAITVIAEPLNVAVSKREITPEQAKEAKTLYKEIIKEGKKIPPKKVKQHIQELKQEHKHEEKVLKQEQKHEEIKRETTKKFLSGEKEATTLTITREGTTFKKEIEDFMWKSTSYGIANYKMLGEKQWKELRPQFSKIAQNMVRLQNIKEGVETKALV